MKRKIAAILAADIAGYSRLVAEDEEETLHRLGIYRAVFEDFVARYGGRIFNTAGDATLAEFQSAVDAVRCAVDLQESLRTRNLAYAPGRQMSFRIGITIGDIVERDGDLLGDGVNIASRLEGLAPAGGICISRAVHEAVTNKVSLKFDDLGPQLLKNIPERVHAYQVALAPRHSSRIPDWAATLGIVGVAVLAIAVAGAGAYLLTQGKFASTSGDITPQTPLAQQNSPLPRAASTSPARETPASTTDANSGSAAPTRADAPAPGGADSVSGSSGSGAAEEMCRRYLPSVGKTVEVPCYTGPAAEPADTTPPTALSATPNGPLSVDDLRRRYGNIEEEGREWVIKRGVSPLSTGYNANPYGLSLAKCRSACLGDGKCSAFYWGSAHSSNNKRCYHYESQMIETVASESGDIWFKQNSAEAATTPAAAAQP